MIHLSPEVRGVLAAATIDGNRLTLTSQLDRRLYQAVDKALVAAGGKWNRAAKAHVFDRDPRVVLGLAVEAGTIADKKADLQQFFTPPGLARRVVHEARIPAPTQVSTTRVLEPSAGEGAIADAARAMGADVFCVELDEGLVATLRSKGFPTTQGDFLEIRSEMIGTFDRVVMNPPFHGHADVRHVRHALSFLRPGGRLVAIMSPGFTFHTDRECQEFRELDELEGWEELPAGSFKAAGTDVRTVLVTMERPS